MDDSPLYIAPFVGFKVLEYVGHGQEHVASPYRSSFWWWPERTREEAHCRTNDSGAGWNHPSPNDNCQCGYYAYYDFSDACDCAQLFRSTLGSNFEFLVAVAAWGEVILHKSGFRSQFMDVIGVHDGSYPQKGAIRRYAESAGVPFLGRIALEDLARESGILPTPEMFA
jgi:hypothetical protein